MKLMGTRTLKEEIFLVQLLNLSIMRRFSLLGGDLYKDRRQKTTANTNSSVVTDRVWPLMTKDWLRHSHQLTFVLISQT